MQPARVCTFRMKMDAIRSKTKSCPSRYKSGVENTLSSGNANLSAEPQDCADIKYSWREGQIKMIPVTFGKHIWVARF